jgi:hypothetical protein
MLKLDNTLLDELGLGSLPEDQKKAMLQHIYETLELRVGTNLANQMTDQQLEEFEKFIDDGGDANQAQALQWLESNLPNYKQVVNEVFEELKGEVKGMADQIMASSPRPTQQVAAPAPQQMQPQQPPQPQQPYQQPAGYAAQPYAAPAPVPMDYGAQQQVPASQAFPQRSAPQQPYQAQVPQGQGVAPGMPPVDPYQQQVQQQAVPPQYDPSQPVQQAIPQPPQVPNGYQFPQQQPPAGPGAYPPQPQQ